VLLSDDLPAALEQVAWLAARFFSIATSNLETLLTAIEEVRAKVKISHEEAGIVLAATQGSAAIARSSLIE
jgi:hypothetical protein